MKKLLLSLGALSAVVAPVAAVVACGSTSDSLKDGQFVDHAFKGKATFANIKGNSDADSKPVTIELRDQDGGTLSDSEFEDLISGLNNPTLDTLFVAIKKFNDEKVYIPTSFTSTDVNNAGVINALKGKELKLEAFYQQDNRGGATFVSSKETLSKLLGTNTFAFDSIEKAHAIALHKVGLRVVAA